MNLMADSSTVLVSSSTKVCRVGKWSWSILS